MSRKFLLIPLFLFLLWAEARPFPVTATTAAQTVTQPDVPLFPVDAAAALSTLDCQAQSGSSVYLPFIISQSAAGQQVISSNAPETAQVFNTPSALDRSVGYDIYEATRFLYTGSNPVQTGVGSHVINGRCVTVLRGNVINRSGQPLSGVAVSLLDHPEFGQTLTDSNGLFNFVLNGGGPVVVEYNKTGYLSLQRRIETTRRQYEIVEPVVLIPPDSKTTTINPASTAVFQVAQSSVVTDDAGSRRSTMLFPSGAFTAMRNLAGSQQALAPLTFRATEFTAGIPGAAAMPGDLPPTSGYTYAVDFSFDEPAGQNVVFDQPVINYTENIVGAPVGSAVPVGYYDEAQARWIPADNGIVIKILAIGGGSASLDVTGDGVADTGAALTALGITPAEQQQLAALYTAGTELWRVLIPHFSPWDFNWPFGPPPDAKEPPVPPPDTNQPGECSESGSIINCDTQALGESLPVTGTPFTLNYTSKRVPGWKVGNRFNVPIVVGDLPASLKTVYMEAQIGGQVIVKQWGRSAGQSFGVPGLYTGTVEALSSNLSYLLDWNGQDGYGRATNGRPLANIMLRYVYDFQYYGTRSEFQQSFGQFGDNVFISNGREYCKYLNYPPAAATAAQFCGINMVVNYSRPLGYWDAAAAVGLGAWSLDVHHAYDTNDGVLHLGDGRDLSTTEIGPVMTGLIPDTVPINYLGDFIVAPDGSLYWIDTSDKKVMRLAPDGTLTHIAGNGSQGMPTGDGGPATQATLGWYLTGLALAPDGSLYIAATYDNYNPGLIRRVDANGIITTVAGIYFNQYSLPNGDGGLATAARLNKPEDILFGPDGSLYIAESPQYRLAGGNYNRIRKITPDGIINTIAGAGGNTSTTADLTGIPALEWGALPFPGRMAFAPDGSLYLTHPNANTVTRIGTDGILRRVAGSGGTGNFGDGGSALNANVPAPQSVAIDANGVVYVRTRYQYYDRVRRISTDDIITTYAGRDTCTGPQDNSGLSARQACLSNFNSNNSLEFGPDGSLIISSSRGRIERMAVPQPDGAFSGQNILIPDPNGMEVYEFSSAGRHLRTLHALTGAVLYTFGYDGNGRLTSITDANQNITTIERNVSGQPTAIVASGGQRTPLTLTAGGYLRTIANPAGNTVTLAYDANGLLTSLTEPRGGVHQFQYDGNGRLTRDTNPAGGVKNLSRLEQPGLTSVTVTTGMGETTTYTVEALANGDWRRTVTAPDGSSQTLIIGEGSVWTLAGSDGMTERVTYAPDPRWGMNAPIPASVLVTTPGALQWQMTAVRTATLSTPGSPFSLSTLQDEMTVNGKIWRYTYAANGRTFTLQTPQGRRLVLTLDAAGRIINTNGDSSGALAPLVQTYDSRGRLTTLTQGSRLTQFGYNNANLVTSLTEPDGKVTTMAYDAAGRMTTITLPGSRVVALGYDANSNLTSVTPPGRTAHTFAYAADDELLSYTPPTVSGGGISQYGYNADRNLTSYTRPGSSISLSYLNNGFHLGSMVLARGTRSQTFDAAGRLQTVSDPDGIGLSYTYDGSLITSRVQSGPVAGSVGFVYNNDLLVNSVSVNSANPIAYQYDNDLMLTGAGGLTISRNPNHGLVTGSQLGSVTDAWTYNTYGEAATYLARFNSSTLYQTTFTRDGNGRITTKTETIGGVTTTYSYTYDAAGRLTEVRQNNSITGSYSYDANGNRLSANGVTATFDAQDRLTQAGSTQYAYTGAGYLASKTVGTAVTTYQYDEAGNLMATLPNGTQLTYLVDGLNRRVGKQVNGTLVQGFLYQNGFRPIAELDGSGNVVSRFVYGTRSNVPEYMIKGGQTYRIISDHLGSPRLVVNVTNGTVAQRLDYDAWGKVTQDTSPGFQPFGFGGGLYDRDTGLVRFGLRDYDPVNGRWTSKDPVGFNAGDTNLYAYVQNDPVNFIDPTGLQQAAAPSPCNPDDDDSVHNFGEFMSKYVGRPLRFIGDGVKSLYNKAANWLEKKANDTVDWISDTYRQFTSSDPHDGAELIKKGIDTVNDKTPLPVTPSEAVTETMDRGVEYVDPGYGNLGRARRGLYDSSN
ncbi:MAG: hypothetical protein H6667_04560 [Ardenticatenaceae bacterium]|nr:hypothetical protein [Ardenticatenaceae bacterium]